MNVYDASMNAMTAEMTRLGIEQKQGITKFIKEKGFESVEG